MAVGQVDILVGLPTLNNAATIVDVVRAVHVCFTRDFPRLRTVMINSDGGSTDGTPELIRDASFTDATWCRRRTRCARCIACVAPYHGLPGKHTALRTVFAAAELTQAKVLVVIDPGGPATTAERVTELIAPDRRGPRSSSSRRAIAGILATASLITQLVRPLVRAVYGVGARRAARRGVRLLRTLCVALSRAGHLGSGRRHGSRSISGCAPKPSPSGSPSARSGGRPRPPPARGRRCARRCARSCCR